MSRISGRAGRAAATMIGLVGLAGLLVTTTASPASAHDFRIQQGGVFLDLYGNHDRLNVCHHSGPFAWGEVRYRNGSVKKYRAPWPGQACFPYDLDNVGTQRVRLCWETSATTYSCSAWRDA